MRVVSILIAIGFVSTGLVAQDCPFPSSIETLHGNQIRTTTTSAGDLFWNRNEARFQVPFQHENSPSTFFAAGLWLGGLDSSGNIRLAASTYPHLTRLDYAPGPLIGGETDPETCERWDRHWVVYRNDINLHLADLNTDGKIDDPVRSIYAWPGRANPHFEAIHGYPLPDDEHFSAPFVDQDGDGVYDPSKGDYPHPENIDEQVIPSQISWTVFNDYGREHSFSGGTPLEFEVQLTAYALSCEDPILDYTIFMSYKVVNRSSETIDSVRLGLWHDPDLGCFTDDYIGSSPDHHSFFIYNQDSIDGTTGPDCGSFSGPVATYAFTPPAQSASLLSHPLESYAYYLNGGVGSYPPGMIDPYLPYEFWNLLNGKFPGGTPITAAGNGYMTDGDTTTLAFFGNPNDSTSWSMYNIDTDFGDRRAIAAARLGSLHPGGFDIVDMAFTFHHNGSLNHIEIVDLMYNRLDTLIAMYSEGLLGACDFSTLACLDDCVWPGDANNDGRVDPIDILTLSTSRELSGSRRLGPLAWQPLYTEDWSATTYHGTNYKHLDTDGDGLVRLSDLSVVDLHFGQTKPEYTPRTERRVGNELVFTSETPVVQANSLFSQIRAEIRFNPFFDEEISGICFTLKVDPNYIQAQYANNEFHGAVNHPEGMKWEWISDSTITVTEAVHRASSKPVVSNIFSFQSLNYARPEVTGDFDTTYMEVVDAYVVHPSGRVRPLPGARMPVIFMQPSPNLQRPKPDEQLAIVPNPSTGSVEVIVEDALLGSAFQVVRSDGAAVQGFEVTSSRTRLELEPGVYVLVCREFSIARKIVIF